MNRLKHVKQSSTKNRPDKGKRQTKNTKQSRKTNWDPESSLFLDQRDRDEVQVEDQDLAITDCVKNFLTAEAYSVFEKSAVLYKTRKINGANSWDIQMSFIPITKQSETAQDIWSASSLSIGINNNIYLNRIANFDSSISEISTAIQNIRLGTKASKKQAKEKFFDIQRSHQKQMSYQPVPFNEIDFSRYGVSTLQKPENINMQEKGRVINDRVFVEYLLRDAKNSMQLYRKYEIKPDMTIRFDHEQQEVSPIQNLIPQQQLESFTKGIFSAKSIQGTHFQFHTAYGKYDDVDYCFVLLWLVFRKYNLFMKRIKTMMKITSGMSMDFLREQDPYKDCLPYGGFPEQNKQKKLNQTVSKKKDLQDYLLQFNLMHEIRDLNRMKDELDFREEQIKKNLDLLVSNGQVGFDMFGSQAPSQQDTITKTQGQQLFGNNNFMKDQQFQPEEIEISMDKEMIKRFNQISSSDDRSVYLNKNKSTSMMPLNEYSQRINEVTPFNKNIEEQSLRYNRFKKSPFLDNSLIQKLKSIDSDHSQQKSQSKRGRNIAKLISKPKIQETRRINFKELARSTISLNSLGKTIDLQSTAARIKKDLQQEGYMSTQKDSCTNLVSLMTAQRAKYNIISYQEYAYECETLASDTYQYQKQKQRKDYWYQQFQFNKETGVKIKKKNKLPLQRNNVMNESYQKFDSQNLSLDQIDQDDQGYNMGSNIQVPKLSIDTWEKAEIKINNKIRAQEHQLQLFKNFNQPSPSKNFNLEDNKIMAEFYSMFRIDIEDPDEEQQKQAFFKTMGGSVQVIKQCIVDKKMKSINEIYKSLKQRGYTLHLVFAGLVHFANVFPQYFLTKIGSDIVVNKREGYVPSQTTNLRRISQKDKRKGRILKDEAEKSNSLNSIQDKANKGHVGREDESRISNKSLNSSKMLIQGRPNKNNEFFRLLNITKKS